MSMLVAPIKQHVWARIVLSPKEKKSLNRFINERDLYTDADFVFLPLSGNRNCCSRCVTRRQLYNQEPVSGELVMKRTSL